MISLPYGLWALLLYNYRSPSYFLLSVLKNISYHIRNIYGRSTWSSDLIALSTCFAFSVVVIVYFIFSEKKKLHSFVRNFSQLNRRAILF